MFPSHNAAVYAFLKEQRLMETADLDELNAEHCATGKSLADVVVDLGLIDRADLLRRIADHLGYDFLPELPAQFPGAAIAAVTGRLARDYGVMPLQADDRNIDLVVADPSASFAITPVNLGVPYNTTGLLHFMGRLRLNVIKELFFTAAPAGAAQALEWGIINWLVPAGEIDAFTGDLARRMAAKAPLAMAVIKEQLRVLSDEVPIAAQTFERLQDMRRMVYDSADFREGIAAFREKRAPQFNGR